MACISVSSLVPVLAFSLAVLVGFIVPASANVPQTLGVHRAALIAEIEKSCGDSEVAARIPSLLVAFEKRMADRTQVERTYHEMSDMLVAEASITSVSERVQLAADVIEQAACPFNINQGKHNTCAFAAIEERMYTLYPRAAAALVKQVALTGQYITDDNDKIQVDAISMRADNEAKWRGYGSRSFASQLFQITAANVYWQRQKKDPNGNKCGRGSIRYVQKESTPLFRGDTGERMEIHRDDDVIETVVGDDGCPVVEPCVSLTEVQDVGTILAQSPQSTFVIAGKKFSRGKRYLVVKSMDDLRKKLSDCQSGSAMPLVAAVDLRRGWLGREPRLKRLTCVPVADDQSGRFAQRLLAAKLSNCSWHAVCVTSYNPENDTVSVDNFWGVHADHVGKNAIPISEFYAAIAAHD